MTRLLLTLILPVVAACELKGVSLTADVDDTTTTTTNAATGTTTDGPGATSTGDPTGGSSTGEAPPATALDILFVIDNSGNMAPRQDRLNESIGALLNSVGDLDLRIAITTTDSGNPRCAPADTRPKGGKFVLESCVLRAAAGDFAIQGTGADYTWACTNTCDIAALNIAATPTTEDPDPKPRKWLERTAGVANVDVPLADALACALPQGISGCGFESPLESMYLALTQASSADSPTNYGFLRPGADLAVVFVTDEMDCSYNPVFKEIFTVNNTFWEDPNAPASTSAVCFNASAACVGGPGTYDSCDAADYDISGDITMDPEEAVLHPVSKYVQLLQQIESTRDVRLFAIAGVPPGFETGDVPLVYADASDPEFQDLFGVAPGCTSADPMNPDTPLLATPPLRILQVAEAFGAPQFFSICDASYNAAMAAVGAH